ncbi:hypothetical protein [Burkholderia glumae]|uniref:hypothetical protein n=1 Tax=Burkholderia glumae TaxID=337 RepID=UPI00214F9B80|nr:hypothetical protein [Burkholderia glumae]
MSKHLSSPANLIEFLNARVDLKALSDEELSDLSVASEIAVDEAQSLSKLIESLGCLVSGDLEKIGTGMTRVGSLQESEVRGLLWYIARQVALIGEIAFIGSEVGAAITHRQESKVALKRKGGANA